MRKINFWGWSAVLVLIAAAALAADTAMEAEVGGAKVLDKQASPPDPSDKPPSSSCLSRCTSRDVRCSSEVRRSRQECARTASMGGRDPMTLREPYDYLYFCGYFSNPRVECGSDFYSAGCSTRFQHRYAMCRDAMYDIAALRYDCYRAERDATRICREELQDCKQSCEE